MARVRLTADVEPELRRQVKIAAASSDKSVSQWVEDAIRREIENGSHHGNGTTMPPPDAAPPEGEIQPIKHRGGALTAKDRELLAQKYPDMHLSPPGAKPKGSVNPIKLRGGGLMSDTVIEDREASTEPYPGMHLPPPGVKPRGLADPPKLREGSGTVADAVIEDRR